MGDRKENLTTAVLDVKDKEGVYALPAKVVDGVINNAGIIQPFVRLANLDYEAIERVLNVNLYGTIYVTKAFLPHLLARPEAHIANASSIGGYLPVPGQTVYGASKAAVKLLTEGLYDELIDTNVTVRAIFYGATETNISANLGVTIPGGEQNTEARKIKELFNLLVFRILINGIMDEKRGSSIHLGANQKEPRKEPRAIERLLKLFDDFV